VTRTFSDFDDIGGTPHLVENRFRLNGAAAIFEIIHTQEFPIRQFEGKQKNCLAAMTTHSMSERASVRLPCTIEVAKEETQTAAGPRSSPIFGG
jgi:hypothetical protein